MAYKSITAKFPGLCKGCGLAIEPGSPIVWESTFKKSYHQACKPAAAAAAGLKASVKAAAQTQPKPYKAPGYSYASPSIAASYGMPDQPAPATQKGKGIGVLQSAGLLPVSMGYVATTIESAIWAFNKIPGQKFCRPCPITPRHGFVDSRPIADIAGLEALWAEAKKADPLAELIIMPMVPATHSIIWRPGLLAVGPGHDGATNGHGSIGVPLELGFAKAWEGLSAQAGVDTKTQAPYVEAVSHDGIDSVLTQIRAGDHDCPTEPDWVPAPMVVEQVIHIDGTQKADPDAMLAWETTAKTLPAGTVVYDEGGNMADHWSVHCRLNGHAVVTSFKPHVGQTLPKMGIDLVPLEPQAIIWGFLGGLVNPSLKAGDEPTRRKRTRATVAAILGTHHGLMMGGAAGEHLGASVALFLRLAQAAVWGEARHAFSHCPASKGELPAGITPAKGKSRQQIFSMVLDDWAMGRAGLRDVVRVMHHPGWFNSGGYGGKAWAAIGHATVALDTAMIELVKLPSRLNAKRVIGALTTAVNLAHNGVSSGCFLNKFCGGDWFDMAASQDPRAAIFAGPVWYEATLAGAEDRMALLPTLEAMEPIVVGYPAPKGNTLAPKVDQGKLKAGHVSGSILGVGVPVPHVPKAPAPVGQPGSKVGSFGPVALGASLGTAGIPGVPVKAQAKGEMVPEGALHFQIELSAGGYVSGTMGLPSKLPRGLAEAWQALPGAQSMGGSGVSSYKLVTVNLEGALLVVTKDHGPVALLTAGVGSK